MTAPFPELLEPYRARVETILREHLPRGGAAARVEEAMAYSLLAGGKRIRPILCILSYEAAGGGGGAVDRAAAAIEMIHTYSLIHDDLPCMDDDDLRRGRPSCHVAHGEAVALLAGDALLTLAFTLLAGADDLPAELRVRMARILGEAVGHEGMIGGQELDLVAETEPVTDISGVERIHVRKTGAFLTAAVTLGAVAAGAGNGDLAKLRRYGDDLGLAFQVADDLLDVTATEEEAGKRVGKDAARGKATYPALLGAEESKKLAQKLVDRAVDALPFDTPERHLAGLARFVVDRID
jgi:geranylgeranyl pyrophosphate synthase